MAALTTGERLGRQLGRFLAAFFVGWGTARLPVVEWPILPLLTAERYPLDARSKLSARRRSLDGKDSSATWDKYSRRSAVDCEPQARRDARRQVRRGTIDHVAADLPGTDEERAEAALIAAAGKILRDGHREIPADFVAGLFAHAAPGRSAALRPARARGACRPTPGRSSRCASRARRRSASIRAGAAGGASGCKTISVLEIVNDDMPFLVNSVMAELTERGLDVRLVVHPVFAVERDAAGRLHRLQAAEAGAPASRARASSTSMSSASTTRRGAPRSSQALEQVLADVRVCVAGLAADDRRASTR